MYENHNNYNIILTDNEKKDRSSNEQRRRQNLRSDE